MDIYAATQAFNAAANKAWTTCDTVDIPGWTLNGPSQPTAGFFAAISYNGRDIARAYCDDANPRSIPFSPTRRWVVALADFKWVVRMIRQGFLLRLDAEFNYWLANCEDFSYHWDFDPGVGVTAPAKA